MQGITHIAGGLAAAILATKTGLIDGNVANYALTMLGATLPDLDAGEAIATKPSELLPFKLGALPIFRPLDAATGIVAKLCQAVLGHRGILHYPLTYVTLYGVWWIAAQWGRLPAWSAEVAPYLPAALVGIASHIALDWLTTRSIPLFAPLSFRLIALPFRIKTGGILEGIFSLALCFAIFYLWRL